MEGTNLQPVLYIIIPCYNEEKVLPITAPLFLRKVKELSKKKIISDDSRIMFVNDGSKDITWELIRSLAEEDEHFIGISQSRNRGHQNSILAGLMEAKNSCDITITMDCDGQDDINAIDDMVAEYLDGAEIVYGVRSKRDTDAFFKRYTAEKFYKLMKWMGAEIVYNHADYRLVSNRVLQELQNFEEVNIFLRGMIPLVGFKSTCVYYERDKRIAGESHYPYTKMFAFALDGITSLTIKPIRMVMIMGAFIALLSFFGVIWSIVSHFLGNTVSGWTSTICIVCFIEGIQLLSLGVIGEYIGKIYLETKHRPRYIISERTENEKSQEKRILHDE